MYCYVSIIVEVIKNNPSTYKIQQMPLLSIKRHIKFLLRFACLQRKVDFVLFWFFCLHIQTSSEHFSAHFHYLNIKSFTSLPHHVNKEFLLSVRWTWSRLSQKEHAIQPCSTHFESQIGSKLKLVKNRTFYYGPPSHPSINFSFCLHYL